MFFCRQNVEQYHFFELSAMSFVMSVSIDFLCEYDIRYIFFEFTKGEAMPQFNELFATGICAGGKDNKKGAGTPKGVPGGGGGGQTRPR